jgi:putative FmdB family regulatory protein
MPTYDYRCSACRHEFEAFQSITARRLRKCPECGQRALERLIGAGAGVLFKGSGFYQTDYANKSSSRRGGSDNKPEAAKGEGKAGAPADKGESKAPSDKGKGGD